MNNSLHVRKVERSRKITDYFQRLFERNPAAVVNEISQRLALDVFEDRVRLVVLEAEIVNRRELLIRRLALVCVPLCAGGKRHQLGRRDDLGQGRLELVVDQCADIELARLEHLGNTPADPGRRIESRRRLGDVLERIDDPVAEVTAQEPGALAPDDQQLDRLAVGGEDFVALACPPGDGTVEAAAQASVRRDENEQVHFVLAGAGKQRRCTGA